TISNNSTSTTATAEGLSFRVGASTSTPVEGRGCTEPPSLATPPSGAEGLRVAVTLKCPKARGAETAQRPAAGGSRRCAPQTTGGSAGAPLRTTGLMIQAELIQTSEAEYFTLREVCRSERRSSRATRMADPRAIRDSRQIVPARRA